MWYPHVTVATVVERRGKFLLVREMADGLEVYNQPAGHLEQNETLVEAAIRETREETGWLVEPTHLLGVSQYTSLHNGITYVRFSFVAEAIQEIPDAHLDDDIIEAVWLTREQIFERTKQLRSPLVLDDMERYRRNQRFPLKLIQQYR